MAAERVAKDGVAYNTGILKLARKWKYTTGTVWDSPGTSSPCPQHLSLLDSP